MVMMPTPEQMLLDLSGALEELTNRQRQLVDCIHTIRMLRTAPEWSTGTPGPVVRPPVPTAAQAATFPVPPEIRLSQPEVAGPVGDLGTSATAYPVTTPARTILPSSATPVHRSNRQYDYFAELDERLARLTPHVHSEE